jgi:hypothetical protein
MYEYINSAIQINNKNLLIEKGDTDEESDESGDELFDKILAINGKNKYSYETNKIIYDNVGKWLSNENTITLLIKTHESSNKTELVSEILKYNLHIKKVLYITCNNLEEMHHATSGYARMPRMHYPARAP